MTMVSERQPPLSEHRASVREYLRQMDLPFESVAGAIVRERLASELEEDLLRPSLVLWACAACSGNLRDALPIAVSFHFFDRFMLLHDELVEERSLAPWGLGQSLNAGDALYALAFRTLAEDVVDAERRLAAAGLVAHAVMQAIEGRNLDIERSARGNDDGLLAQVRSVRRRSAELTGAALSAGALVAGASETTRRAFDRAGRLMTAVATIDDAQLARRIGDKAIAAIRRCVQSDAHVRAFEDVVRHLSAKR